MVINLSAEHSVVSNWLSELRDVDVQDDRLRFRHSLARIGEVDDYGIRDKVTWEEEEETTPLGTSRSK